jgi:hypothetical protein
METNETKKYETCPYLKRTFNGFCLERIIGNCIKKNDDVVIVNKVKYRICDLYEDK